MMMQVNVNFVKIIFALWTVATVGLGALLNLCEDRLPVFIARSFRYGKFACTKNCGLASGLEIPKSTYRHFYVFAAFIFAPLLMYEVTKVYIFRNNPSERTLSILDLTCGYNRTAAVSEVQVFVGSLLITLQIYRRFYDTMFVSVFSKKAKINVAQYLIGCLHYPALMLAILCEAPKFSRPIGDQLSQWSLSFTDYLGLCLFCWAWVHQYNCNAILANLRKNKKGTVVNEGYSLPKGDWFEYLSSPHSVAEILMYTALTLILRNNSTWWYVYAWVISNQVATILLSHWWYQSTFKNFPQQRKALIPFVF